MCDMVPPPECRKCKPQGKPGLERRQRGLQQPEQKRVEFPLPCKHLQRSQLAPADQREGRIDRRHRGGEQQPVPDAGASQQQGRQHQTERLGARGQPQREGGQQPAAVPGQHHGRQQQAGAGPVRVRREGDLLDHQRTPGIEQHVARRRQAQ